MKKIISVSALFLALSTPAWADPTFGFGFNITFGGGQVNPGIGVRAFSDDEEDEAVASLGIDYMFNSQSIRGSLGAAYLFENSYIELNGGYDFGRRVFEIGASTGYADTNKDEDDDEDEEETTTDTVGQENGDDRPPYGDGMNGIPMTAIN